MEVNYREVSLEDLPNSNENIFLEQTSEGTACRPYCIETLMQNSELSESNIEV